MLAEARLRTGVQVTTRDLDRSLLALALVFLSGLRSGILLTVMSL